VPEFVHCWTAALIGSAALCACATFTPEPLAPQAMLGAFEVRSLDDPELQRYVASHLQPREAHAVGAWDLESLTVAGYYYSPDLDVARAKSAVADATMRTASRRPNPTLQMPFGYTSNAKPGESPYTLGLGLDLPIETAGKRGYRIAQARRLSIAAQFEVGAAAWQLRSRLRTQLLAMFSAERRGRLLERQVQLREQVAQLLDKRLALGAASAPEAQQAHAALVQARAERAKAQVQWRDAQLAAAATIGVPLAALRQASIRLDAFAAPVAQVPAEAVREQALLNRADSQSALARYEASQAALQLEVANQYPDVHLGPGYTFDAGAHKYALSLTGIPLALFDRNEGPIAEATARRKEAAARFGAVQAQAIAQADQAFEHYQAAQTALHLADWLLASQRYQLEVTRKWFAAGLSDRLNLVLAELDERSAELARDETVARLQSAVGEMEDAMQRPLAGAAGTRH
jgi:outer membrane protein TolC